MRTILRQLLDSLLALVIVLPCALYGAWEGFRRCLEQPGLGGLSAIVALVFGLPIGLFAGMIVGLLIVGVVKLVFWIANRGSGSQAGSDLPAPETAGAPPRVLDVVLGIEQPPKVRSVSMGTRLLQYLVLFVVGGVIVLVILLTR
jgi:hypothetical protein